MTLATLDFYTVVLFVHIVAAIVAFGVTFGYPLLFTLADHTSILPMNHQPQ